MTYTPDRFIILERQTIRATALTIPCPYCLAPAGEECVIPRTENRLVKQPAHMRRIQDSGGM